MVSQWVVLVSCVYPMLRSDWLSLALCQFVLSPSLWLTAYLSAVRVVHCAYCSTLFLHCQEDFFFLLVRSVVLPSRRELVAHRVRPVRCSAFFHPIHLALQMDSFGNVGRCACWRSVRVILDCPYCITMFLRRQQEICNLLGRNFVRMVYHTPVGYPNCQLWHASSTVVVRDYILHVHI